MHDRMAQMRPKMMSHMMEHMRMGMMQSMGECPLMKESAAPEPSGDAGHAEHHPDAE